MAQHVSDVGQPAFHENRKGKDRDENGAVDDQARNDVRQQWRQNEQEAKPEEVRAADVVVPPIIILC